MTSRAELFLECKDDGRRLGNTPTHWSVWVVFSLNYDRYRLRWMLRMTNIRLGDVCQSVSTRNAVVIVILRSNRSSVVASESRSGKNLAIAACQHVVRGGYINFRVASVV